MPNDCVTFLPEDEMGTKWFRPIMFLLWFCASDLLKRVFGFDSVSSMDSVHRAGTQPCTYYSHGCHDQYTAIFLLHVLKVCTNIPRDHHTIFLILLLLFCSLVYQVELCALRFGYLHSAVAAETQQTDTQQQIYTQTRCSRFGTPCQHPHLVHIHLMTTSISLWYCCCCVLLY